MWHSLVPLSPSYISIDRLNGLGLSLSFTPNRSSQEVDTHFKRFKNAQVEIHWLVHQWCVQHRNQKLVSPRSNFRFKLSKPKLKSTHIRKGYRDKKKKKKIHIIYLQLIKILESVCQGNIYHYHYKRVK